MGKRLIISEEERNEIFSKYQIIEEQAQAGFTISSIRDVKYPDMIKKIYKIANLNGRVAINGVTAKIGDMIKPSDKLSMDNNAFIQFEPIPGFGQVTLSYINTKPYMEITTD